MLLAGVVTEKEFEYSSRIVLVKKEGTNKFLACVDLRHINLHINKLAKPMIPMKVAHKLSGAEFIILVDIEKA